MESEAVAERLRDKGVVEWCQGSSRIVVHMRLAHVFHVVDFHSGLRTHFLDSIWVLRVQLYIEQTLLVFHQISWELSQSHVGGVCFSRDFLRSL